MMMVERERERVGGGRGGFKDCIISKWWTRGMRYMFYLYKVERGEGEGE